MWTHLLVALSLKAGCPDPMAIATSPQLQREIADEGEIISAAIDNLYAKTTKGGFVVQAVNQQIVEPIAVDFRSHLANAADAGGPILDDYIRRNSAACDLSPVLASSSIAGKATLVSDDALAPLRHGTVDDYWQAFYHSYPGSGGLIVVARPGIDPSGARAFLYIGRDCGTGCGTWGYAWLRKQNWRWRVERYIVISPG